MKLKFFFNLKKCSINTHLHVRELNQNVDIPWAFIRGRSQSQYANFTGIHSLEVSTKI